jgi:long-chain acyl-CoA synthetase
MPKLKTLRDYLDHIAEYGDQTALVSINSSKEITYSKLVAEIYNLSYFLRKKIDPGERVILHKIKGADWVKSFFAVILVGGIVVPIDDRVSDDMLCDIIELTEPTYALTATGFTFNIAYFNIENPLEINQAVELPELNPDLPCEIIFTSGTWSKPKGVTLSQSNLLANMEELITNVYRPDEFERFLSVLPLAHSYEQMVGLLVPLYSKATIYYLNQITSASFRKALSVARPHYIVAVPRVLQLMQNSILRQIPKLMAPASFKSMASFSRILPIFLRRLIFTKVQSAWGGCLHTLIVGGAPIDAHLDNFFQGLGLRIFIGYGLSETSPVISVSKRQQRLASEVGEPLTNIEVKLNEDGEILVRGESVFLGYWPILDRQSKTFFNTNDVGVITKDNRLLLKGRTKNLIIYPSGDKIFAEDIEYLASQIDSVKEVCAVNISDLETPDIYIVYTGVDDNLVDNVRQKLPFFVRVQGVLKFDNDELPKTHTLKIKRQVLKEWVRAKLSSSF